MLWQGPLGAATTGEGKEIANNNNNTTAIRIPTILGAVCWSGILFFSTNLIHYLDAQPISPAMLWHWPLMVNPLPQEKAKRQQTTTTTTTTTTTNDDNK